MAMRCVNCGKGSMYGHRVSHAKNRSAKVFKPNLHNVRIQMGTNMKKMRLCTKCLRMIKRATAAKTETPKATATA